VALIIAGFIGWNGVRLGRRTIDTLMDRAPKGATEAIRGAVEAVPGVVSLDQLRLREVGPETLAEVIVTVNRTLPLERVVEIKDAITAAATKAFAGTVPTITANPVALDDETVMERVHLTARRHSLAVHHVTVQHLGEKLCVGLDLEVDGAMSFSAAHDVASDLETAVRRELGEDIEVESHIEPMLTAGLGARDAGAVTRMTFSGILSELAAETGRLAFVHDVRVRVNDEGLFVTCHCFAQPGQTVAEVHDAVDALERGFRRRVPEVRRMIVHAEPRG
jgi:divalent metal cation (Fe/Co/Zn/Cd) transporter